MNISCPFHPDSTPSVKVFLPNGETLIFDLEGWLLYQKKKWKITLGYLNNHGPFHRLLLGLKPKEGIVDHINGNALDNRRSNLRVVDKSINAINTFSKRKTANATSLYRGVSFKPRDVKGKPWASRIRLAGISYVLGYYGSEIEANKAYEKASKEYLSEYKVPKTRR